MTNIRYNNETIGPIVDSDAPYSAIGWTGLCVLRSSIGEPIPPYLDPLSNYIRHWKWWQYGAGSHASGKHRILGSIQIECASDL